MLTTFDLHFILKALKTCCKKATSLRKVINTHVWSSFVVRFLLLAWLINTHVWEQPPPNFINENKTFKPLQSTMSQFKQTCTL